MIMKKNKDCNCKTKKNAEKLIGDFKDSNKKKSNKNPIIYALKFILYTFILFIIILFSIPLIIYVITNKKPIIIRNNKLLRL